MSTPDETTAARVELMSEERIAELRATSERVLNGSVLIKGGMVYDMAHRIIELTIAYERQRAVIAERDAEIARLRGWLALIERTEDEAEERACARWSYAQRARVGEAVPDER